MARLVRKDSYYLNSRSTTGTSTRVDDTAPISGLCPLCIRECPTVCETSLSAFRGREALYPDPAQFGTSTAGAVKDSGLDWSHLNILSSLLEAEGIEPSSEVAIFPNVNVESAVGEIKLRLPIIVGAFGSTEVARVNWDGLAVGGALSGIAVIIGENVCGMDMDATFTDGKVTQSKELKRRVDSFRNFWDGKYGEVIVQTNVEDQRFGVDTYALSKLEVNVIERKWGQGAKAIGGEVRIDELAKATELKKRGYIVIPDPEDKAVKEAFKDGVFRTFERHSRVGMPSERGFLEDIDWLRQQGAKQIGLKTGAYRPSAVAFAMKLASESKLDYVAFDGAGGGTGMSPVPMMDDMSTPTLYLEMQVLRCVDILKKKDRYIPDIVIAGGFINETQILKAIALSNYGYGPHIKAVLMARAPLTSIMKSSYFVELAKRGRLPSSFKERYGDTPDKFFIVAPDLKKAYGDRISAIPWEAMGLYTYLSQRIAIGLQQLLAGVRKWRLDLIRRTDLVALTERVSKVTGIPLPEENEKEAIETILN